jgi:hypothetical protein
MVVNVSEGEMRGMKEGRDGSGELYIQVVMSDSKRSRDTLG